MYLRQYSTLACFNCNGKRRGDCLKIYSHLFFAIYDEARDRFFPSSSHEGHWLKLNSHSSDSPNFFSNSLIIIPYRKLQELTFISFISKYSLISPKISPRAEIISRREEC